MADDFYRAFEERYRGSREMIKARLRVYLPFIDPMKAIDPAAVALDLGCGRGEWLELMREVGMMARGVDLDEGMLAACRERDLLVEQGEAVALLRGLPGASVAVVSAFHVAEHIPFGDLQLLVREALRVLRPGGLMILETPNPENLVVGTSSFYLDPTHQRPLPPQLLSFLAQHFGFARSAVLRLQEPLLAEGAVRLWDVLSGVSPDFAVVAQKGGATPDEWQLFDRAFAATHGLQLPELAGRYDAAVAARFDAVAAELGGRLQAQRTEVDESRSMILARLTELKTECDTLRASVDEMGGRLQAQRAEVDELRSTILAQLTGLRTEGDALRASWSWRITAPLRLASRPFLRDRPAAVVAAPLRPLVAAMRRVLRDPQRSYRLNQRLMRLPWLHGWLVDLSKRAGIYPGLSGAAAVASRVASAPLRPPHPQAAVCSSDVTVPDMRRAPLTGDDQDIDELMRRVEYELREWRKG